MMSLRHQDWVIKIDYQNGAGTGAVIWNFHFDNGFLGSPVVPVGEALELRPDGSTAFALRTTGFVYRSFRMLDLYRP